jgi:hypothetical protein
MTFTVRKAETLIFQSLFRFQNPEQYIHVSSERIYILQAEFPEYLSSILVQAQVNIPCGERSASC